MLKTKEFEPNIRDYLQAEQIDNFFLIDTIGLGSFTDKARRDQPKIYLDPKYYIKEITIKIYVFVSPHDYVLAEDLELDMQHFSAYCKPENILVFLNKRNP